MWTIPPPMPDEFIAGYRGRVRLLNGISTFNSRPVLNSRTNVQAIPKVQRSDVVLFGVCAGVDPTHFIRSHSLMPLRHAISNSTRCSGNWLARPLRDNAWLCESCVEEDREFWGVAYWRRSHQVPGAARCSKHRTPLKHIDVSAFADVPRPEMARRVDRHFLLTNDSCPIAQRFVDICTEILDVAPLTPTQLRCALGNRAKELGVRGDRRAKEASFGELIMPKLPIAWAFVLMPQLRGSRHELVQVLNAACRRRTSRYVPAVALPLAAASLFESSDAAMKCIRAAEASKKPLSWMRQSIKRTDASCMPGLQVILAPGRNR
jgi:hypothetical protein